jgi:hypothetical protein
VLWTNGSKPVFIPSIEKDYGTRWIWQKNEEEDDVELIEAVQAIEYVASESEDVDLNLESDAVWMASFYCLKPPTDE